MQRFSRLLNESKNTHMEHIEDLILNQGVKGARAAITQLLSLRDMLAGHSTQHNTITIKWDGAPAIFAGIDPSDGKFFVAKKGIFNKNPKVYKTEADVDDDSSGDLAHKLKIALRYFPALGIKGVIQGDLLFTKDTVSVDKIDNEPHYTFHPNTIVYAIPKDSKLGQKIARAEIGVVWHTVYTGDSFETMKASFGKSISTHLKDSAKVWHTDATFRDVSGTATMTKAETAHVTSILSQAGKIFQSTPAAAINMFSQDDEILVRTKAYLNSFIRQGKAISNPTALARGMINTIEQFYADKAALMKTAAGKQKWEAKRKQFINDISRVKITDIANVFQMIILLADAKQQIINVLNRASATKTLLKTKDGFRVTSPEGYVAIDHVGSAVKLVDRMEFSKANFGSDVLKGWQR